MQYTNCFSMDFFLFLVLIKLLFVYVFSSIINLSDSSAYTISKTTIWQLSVLAITLLVFSQVWCHLAWLRSCQCESVAAVTPLLPSFPLSVFQSLSSSCLFCHCDVTWLILLKFLSASVFVNSLLCLATGALSFSVSCWCAFMFFCTIYLRPPPQPIKCCHTRRARSERLKYHTSYLTQCS